MACINTDPPEKQAQDKYGPVVHIIYIPHVLIYLCTHYTPSGVEDLFAGRSSSSFDAGPAGSMDHSSFFCDLSWLIVSSFLYMCVCIV